MSRKPLAKLLLFVFFIGQFSHFYLSLLFAPNQRRVCADGVDKMPGLLFTSENIGWIYVSSQNESEAINWISLKFLQFNTVGATKEWTKCPF